MRVRTRTVAAAAAVVFGFSASQGLFAQCAGTIIAYELSGSFAPGVVSGDDKLKLAGGPFHLTMYGCSTLPPTESGPNYTINYPVKLTATVKSALLPNPYTIKPAQMTLTVADPATGVDFVALTGPVDIFGSTINVQGTVALPAGTLTVPGEAVFSAVSIVTAQSAFKYMQGTDSTTLAVRGMASASVYTAPPAAGAKPLLYSNAGQVTAAHSDGTQSVRPLQASVVDMGASSDRVMLRFYASGVRDASSVRVQIAGQYVPMIYFGVAGYFPGLDEVTVEVPRSLAGIGDADVVLNVDGQTADPVRIHIQ
ncbi:MAG: hypothetical protein ABSF54_17035 [Bryobacteraceae bacterium]|jgi:uncharacterized protein (TIGR03437 family)